MDSHNKREPEPWETCPLTRLIFFFLGADLMMMVVRVIEGIGERLASMSKFSNRSY